MQTHYNNLPLINTNRHKTGVTKLLSSHNRNLSDTSHSRNLPQLYALRRWKVLAKQAIANTLWKMEGILGKVLMFMWKIVRNQVTCKDNLPFARFAKMFLNLLNTCCSIAHGVGLYGLEVGKCFGLIIWRLGQLIDGWRTCFVGSWQRKQAERIQELFFSFVGQFGKLGTTLFSTRSSQIRIFWQIG